MALVVLALGAAGTVLTLENGGGSEKRAAPDARRREVSVKGVAEVGSPAPDFELARLDGGGRLRLSSLRGRPVVLNFWASWCIPCRHEFPLLRATRRKYGGERLEVVGIVYQDVAADAREFARRQHATWPLLVDAGRAAADAYGVRAIPQTFFITPDGRIAQRVFGLASAAFVDAQVAEILPRRPGRGR